MIWRYADFVLERDQHEGVEIFIQLVKGHKDESKERKIVDFLGKYSEAQLAFLEHLIYTKGSEVEAFNTLLAGIYLNKVDKEDNLEAKTKFKSLIMNSSSMRFDALLAKVEKCSRPLRAEKAILLGKLGDHDQALNILALQLKDGDAAENYCDSMNDKSLLFKLLRTYINGGEDFHRSAIDLLNRRGREFPASETLPILPAQWSLAAVQVGLEKLLARSVETKRSKRLEAALLKTEMDNLRYEHYLLTKDPVMLGKHSYCMACKKSFNKDLKFARYPNGVIVHYPECVKDKRICPVTGKMF